MCRICGLRLTLLLLLTGFIHAQVRPIQIASLRPDQPLRLERTSPTRSSLDGPVLYQLVFRFVVHDNTLVGNGSNAFPLAIAPNAISAGNIATGQVVKSLNGLFDNVNLLPGTGITIVENGQTVTIASTTGPAWSLAGNSGTGCTTSPCSTFLGTTDTSALEMRVMNDRALRLEPASDVGLGYTPNIIAGFSANQVIQIDGTSFGGSTIAGGGAGLGRANTVSGSFGTIGGGLHNTITGLDSATIAGGQQNTASASLATICGGNLNVASALGATVVGGQGNTASGNFSLAAGQSANTNGFTGSFVWGDDSTATEVKASANSQFTVRAAGGVQFFSSPDATNTGSGCFLAASGTSWSCSSDRDLKENFEPVDGLDVLAKLTAMPITTWNIKRQAFDIRHLGPTAQDFYSAFGLGEDDRHISVADEPAVALAAIQGMNQKLEREIRQKEMQIATQQRQIEFLSAEIAAQRRLTRRMLGRLTELEKQQSTPAKKS